jgi:3-dehydroquinate synthase
VLKLEVSLAERSYPILIGESLLSDTAALERHLPARDLLLVSNTTVGPLYADAVRRALPGRNIVDVRLPDGEQYKTLEYVSRVLDVLVANRFGRDCTVLALGGGVVGTWPGSQRPLPARRRVSQLPPCWRRWVRRRGQDRVITGRQGIGAFHSPRGVPTLHVRTLPARELRWTAEWSSTAGVRPEIPGMDRHNVVRCWAGSGCAGARDPSLCQLKAEVVRRDEREAGDRALLNLGHTFGHAIETATGYTEWLHGEAVATGMVIAADMSARLGMLTASDAQRVRDLLARIGLPVEAPRLGAARALEFMSLDKKVKAGRIRLVLLARLGAARFTADYADDALQSTLASHFG